MANTPYHRTDPLKRAEAKAAYRDAIVDANHFRDSAGNIKPISRAATAFCAFCGKALDSRRKFCDRSCSRRHLKRSRQT
jgi:hypothetical protein